MEFPSSKNYILFLQTSEGVDAKLKAIQDMYKLKGNNAIFDFYITCYGDISNLQDIAVVVGNGKLNCISLISAIDSLFKLVRALKKEFPVSGNSCKRCATL